MKRGFSTLACMQASVEELVEACKKYGMEGVEIRLGKDGSVLGATDKRELTEIRRKCRNAGVTVTNLGSDLCFTGHEETIPDFVGDMITYASLVGARGIRVFLGYFSQKVDSDPPVPDYQGIVKHLKRLCEMAAEKSVEIWVETHNEFATGKVLKKLLQDVACDNLKVLWDVMHPIEDGETVQETWQTIGGSVAHVHLKDGYKRQDESWHDFCYTPMGEGELPLGEALEQLKNGGYEGYLSLEWERLWRPELASCENTLDWILGHYAEYMERQGF